MLRLSLLSLFLFSSLAYAQPTDDPTSNNSPTHSININSIDNSDFVIDIHDPTYSISSSSRTEADKLSCGLKNQNNIFDIFKKKQKIIVDILKQACGLQESDRSQTSEETTDTDNSLFSCTRADLEAEYSDLDRMEKGLPKVATPPVQTSSASKIDQPSTTENVSQSNLQTKMAEALAGVESTMKDICEVQSSGYMRCYNVAHIGYRAFRSYWPMAAANPPAGFSLMGFNFLFDVFLRDKMHKKALEVVFRQNAGKASQIIYILSKVVNCYWDPTGELSGAIALKATKLLLRLLPMDQIKGGKHIQGFFEFLAYLVGKEAGHTTRYAMELAKKGGFYSNWQQTSGQDPNKACNGLESNCKLPLSKIVMLRSHNAYANLQDQRTPVHPLGFIYPNQIYGVEKQFKDFGIRSFQFEITSEPHWEDANKPMAHGDPVTLSHNLMLNYGSLVDTLSIIKKLLDENPREVVNIFFGLQDKNNTEFKIDEAMKKSGLNKYMPVDEGDFYLPLESLINKGVRLLVTPDTGIPLSSEIPGSSNAALNTVQYHAQFQPVEHEGMGSYETIYINPLMPMSCDASERIRMKGTDMINPQNRNGMLLNHMSIFAIPEIAEKVNQSILKHYSRCKNETGISGAFINVDHVQTVPVETFEEIQKMNGWIPPKR